MNQEWRPDPEPIETNDVATIAVGTGLWAVALVVLLVLRPGPEHQWWIWTCAVGAFLGLLGLWYVHRRATRS
ncbi:MULTISPECIES: DUF2530 domain-containing protein [unclassified Nonomuraea]|uniref:DUF2530 domain-containing protein n=1 Tax=unclassified Nonomuraea TaxID=2593643 RepID=UPI0033FCAD26